MEHRRKWDKSEYERLANERISKEIDALRSDRKGGEEPTKRELLKARDFSVKLDSNLNKSVVISKTGPGGGQAGYFCNVCDCVVKDSINYLDHINGKKHQRNLGMSMRIERSSLDDVKKRFELIKAKKVQVDKEKDYDFEERVAIRTEEDAKYKATRRERKKEKRQRDVESLEEYADNDVASAMGFGSFGCKKSKK